MKRISSPFRHPLFLFLLSLLTACLRLEDAKANLVPRESANAYMSSYAVGQADVMLPMLGRRGDDSHNLYLDPNVMYASNGQWVGDLGLGYRWVQNNTAVLGYYVFGGYTRLDNNVRMFVANPGVEILASRWDLHLNGYFPLGARNTVLEETLGTPFFSGHSELVPAFSRFQKVGNGGDVQVGYQLFPGNSLKARAGSYFFSPQGTDNVWGGIGGLEYWWDQDLKLFLDYSYDNVHGSVGAVGLGVEFGGVRTTRHDPRPEERIMDPVVRYLAELGRGSAMPSQTLSSARTVVLADNIAFFSQSGGPNNGGMNLNIDSCTFENPCGPSDLSNAGASALSSLLPNTKLYFNGGSYDALSVSGVEGVILQPGQTVSSRTPDYKGAVTVEGGGASTFNGGFNLTTNNRLNGVIVLPTSNFSARGVRGLDGTGIVITDSQIGSPTDSFVEGVRLDNNSQVVIDKSVIYANNLGFFVQNDSQLQLLNSSVIVEGNLSSAGIQSDNNASITIVNSQVSVTASGQTIDGLFTFGTSSITASGTTVTVINTNASNKATGLTTADTATIQFNEGSVSVTGGLGSAITRPDGASLTITPTTSCTLNNVAVVCP
jgi:hypothetical protein